MSGGLFCWNAVSQTITQKTLPDSQTIIWPLSDNLVSTYLDIWQTDTWQTNAWKTPSRHAPCIYRQLSAGDLTTRHLIVGHLTYRNLRNRHLRDRYLTHTHGRQKPTTYIKQMDTLNTDIWHSQTCRQAPIIDTPYRRRTSKHTLDKQTPDGQTYN